MLQSQGGSLASEKKGQRQRKEGPLVLEATVHKDGISIYNRQPQGIGTGRGFHRTSQIGPELLRN